MGCDIHPHIEVKYKGKWIHYSSPPIQRCYGLFARICGVRNNLEKPITPIDMPRGLPEDISEFTRECWEWDSGHSATWLSARELDEVIRFHETYAGYLTGQPSVQHNQWGYLCGNDFGDPKSYPNDVTDCRLICWFDN